jgi:outer membrane protein TolC
MFETARVFGRLSWIAGGVWILTASVAAQSPMPQHITLTQAQSKAVGSKGGADLAQLAVDAARYHRQAVQADYFPKIDSTFANLHFNKFLGQTFQLARRTADLPLFTKDQTIVVVTVTQPVTPLLKVREAVEIARADEVIAKNKAAYLAAQLSAEVERTYFAILIAQRRRTVAETTVRTIESGLQVTTTGLPPLGAVGERHSALLKASKELETVNGELTELTRSLNIMIGNPAETELELAVPEPAANTVSLGDATQQALSNSPEVIEAEQGVVKARAATRLSKLDYVQDVAILGGYVYEVAIPLLPRDFSFVGVVATLNIFDFGKRERTISERKTQLSMAQANVDLVRTKVAASAQKAFLDLQRTGRMRDLTRQLASQISLVNSADFRPEARAAWAQTELEMFQAELDYRAAYSQLKRIMEGR